MENTNDIQIENILLNTESKKRINCGRKGKSAEREIVHILNKRFIELLNEHPDWGGFSRSIGSGNRLGQGVILSQQAKEVFGSDLVCPNNFLFSIESKCGYNEIDLCTLFDGGQSELDSFLDQASRDAEKMGKTPMLIWKKDRKPRLVFIKEKTLNLVDDEEKFSCELRYKGWIAVPLQELLFFPDTFFFNML